MKKLTMMLCLLAGAMCAKAQIGYQISLLNTATGEPRANETVMVTVSLSNSEGKVFYSETKSATTNDFGVLSLSVGNADTFKEVDLAKMPFYIEASANGVMIGKSQILSVPVAEVAKQVAPIDIVGTTWHYYEGSRTLTFKENGIVDDDGSHKYYEVDGTFIYLYNTNGKELDWVFKYYNGRLIRFRDGEYYRGVL